MSDDTLEISPFDLTVMELSRSDAWLAGVTMLSLT